MSDIPRSTVTRRDLVETLVTPAAARRLGNGTLLLDFGRAAFGTLILPPMPRPADRPLVVHLGETLAADGRVDREPPGTVRYTRIEQQQPEGNETWRLLIPPDKRNTGPGAVAMPDRIGEVYPFRYAEIEDADGIDPRAVRQTMVHYPFDDQAAEFTSSDDVLNAVWDLCKYSIKATTFCGVYVDGDRERIPYEADAYINQLGHYCVDSEYALARYTHEYLIQFPTWPTEWQMYSVMMAWMDYAYSGETASLAAFYDDLCVKTLTELARPDGLISVDSAACTREFEERLHLYHPRYVFNHGLRDLVDWPPGSFTQGGQGERDGHEMLPVNTVVNAFHAHALQLMSRIAAVLGRDAESREFTRRAAQVTDSINRLLYDSGRGAYVDGEGATHASLHSNIFMLAFGLVPAARRQSVLDVAVSRGMACSVYAAQFLLEALYLQGAHDAALALLTATHDRSWWHMLEIGSTITLEAWDYRYKNNLDWNHAWGAAPANIIPRFLMGVRPLEPGFDTALVQPRPGALESARIKHPTRHGPLVVNLTNTPGEPFSLDISVPEGMNARVDLPWSGATPGEARVDGVAIAGPVADGFMQLPPLGPGTYRLSAPPLH